MDRSKLKTIADLKSYGWESKTIKDELRDNLINSKKHKVDVFSGIHGYSETVIPDLERAILTKHDIIFLGLAKNVFGTIRSFFKSCEETSKKGFKIC